MRVLTAPMVLKEVGWRFAFASGHFQDLPIFVSVAGALGIRTSASGGKTSQKREEFKSPDPTTQSEGDSSEARVSSLTSITRNYGRQEPYMRLRSDDHQLTGQQRQQNAGSREFVSAKNVDSLRALAEEGRWHAIVTALAGSPPDQSARTLADCFIWLGRSGKHEASVTLFELLKKAGESEENISQYLRVFTSSLADSYGAEQAYLSLRALEERVQLKADTILFEGLISDFCSEGLLSQALDILDDMQHRGLTLSSTTFNPILKSFSDHLMLDEAFETLAGMRRLGIETSLASYNIVIGACVRARDMEKAYGVLNELQQQGIRPDTTSFNHIMKGFGQEKRLRRALSILREMEYIGLKPNKDTYLILLRACGTSKDLNEAKKLFKKVEELGLGTDQAILNATLQVYVDNAQLDFALKVVKKLELKGRSIGINGKSQLLRGLALAGRLEEALKVYEELQQSGKLPSPESVATLLVALRKTGRMEIMLKIFQDSNCSGSWSEYPVAYRASYINIFCIHICLGYIRHKQPEGAVQFLQHNSKLGVTKSKTLYDKIFLQIAGSGSEGQELTKLDAADGLALLRALKDQGIQLSRIAHETLLDHCASLFKSKEAWEIVREMEKENLPLNVMSRIRLFRVFVAARKEDEAEKVLNGISKQDLSDRDVRLLLQKIVELEIQRTAASARNVSSFGRLLVIQKQLKQYLQLQHTGFVS